jgi:hypothetical protein
MTPMNTDWLTRRRGGAETLLRRGVGEGLGGDFQEGVGGKISDGGTVVVQGLQQAGHCRRSLLSESGKGSEGCATRHNMVALEGSNEGRHYQRGLILELAEGVNGEGSHLVVGIVETMDQRWRSRHGVSAAFAKSLNSNPLRAVALIGQGGDQWAKGVAAEMAKGTARIVSGAVRPVEDADQGWNCFPAFRADTFQCRASEDGAPGVVFRFDDGCGPRQSPGLSEKVREATPPSRWIVCKPLHEIGYGLGPYVANGFGSIWIWLVPIPGVPKVQPFDIMGQRTAMVGRLAGPGEGAKEKGKPHKQCDGENSQDEPALWHRGSVAGGGGGGKESGRLPERSKD